MVDSPNEDYYRSRRYRWFWLWHALFDGTRLCRCERSWWIKERIFKMKNS